MAHCTRNLGLLIVCALIAVTAPSVCADEVWRFVLPEQRNLEIRDPSQLPSVRLPNVPMPDTVSHPLTDPQPWNLSLDDAIRTALANSEVIRVLAGTSATSSGRTIYDPAITNTQIDQARATFDPRLQVDNNFYRSESPQASLIDPNDPTAGVLIDGLGVETHRMSTGLSKSTITGGSASLNVDTDWGHTNTGGLALNPQTGSSLEMGLTQPLLQGGGSRVNTAPILLARIDTERSFFQLKDSVQQMVTGVIEAYWALVFARTDVWARRQQVMQGTEAFLFAEASLSVGRGNAADVAQSRSALANFRAGLIVAEANLIQREAALRNILGLPPSGPSQIVPVSQPSLGRLDVDWDNILRTAEVYRPDLIELKLILEADEQSLLMARNQALPRVDAVALYRWNGLEGKTPDRTYLGSRPGQFTDWQLGVNFSVPLGLRQSRAELRRQELVIMRDLANLQQGLHNASHVLATSYRNLALYYEQYEAYKETRSAAAKNLDVQAERYRVGQENALFLNVLQAISDWGNSISSEAQALTTYNAELANLEQQTGTILQQHGIRFYEERLCSIGPLGRAFQQRPYPGESRLGPNASRYPTGTEPSENVFNLDDPLPQRRRTTPPEPIPMPVPER